MGKITRCKFVCQSIRKSFTRVYNEEMKKAEPKMLFTAELTPVMDGSEENKRFFQYTPSGKFEVGQYKEDVFEPGKEYFIDITLAE